MYLLFSISYIVFSFFFFKQKTAYEMRISDWSSDVCSSDLYDPKSGRTRTDSADVLIAFIAAEGLSVDWILETHLHADHLTAAPYLKAKLGGRTAIGARIDIVQGVFKKIFNAEARSEEHTSELQSLMRISYAVFCLKHKHNNPIHKD